MAELSRQVRRQKVSMYWARRPELITRSTPSSASKYMPHQNRREVERRLRRAAA